MARGKYELVSLTVRNRQIFKNGVGSSKRPHYTASAGKGAQCLWCYVDCSGLTEGDFDMNSLWAEAAWRNLILISFLSVKHAFVLAPLLFLWVYLIFDKL